MNKKRLDSERTFHDNRFANHDKLRTDIKKYYSINKIALEKYYNKISNICKGRKLLEYGCGTGNNIKKFNDFGAYVTGVDISSEGINKAKERNSQNELNANCFVMDAENTEFENNSFDIIVGMGIIHHLKLQMLHLNFLILVELTHW